MVWLHCILCLTETLIRRVRLSFWKHVGPFPLLFPSSLLSYINHNAPHHATM
ncbi:unnamed protein product [Arabidopsis halleri]